MAEPRDEDMEIVSGPDDHDMEIVSTPDDGSEDVRTMPKIKPLDSMSGLEAAGAQVGEGIYGVPVAGAAAIYDAIAKKKNLLDAYKARRTQQKSFAAQGRKEHPGSSMLGMLGSGIGEMALANAAVPGRLTEAAARAATPITQKAALEMAKIHAALTAGEYARSKPGTTPNQSAVKALEDMAAGQALGLIGEAAMQPIKSVGKGMQLPQKIAESISNKVGGTKAGRKLSELGGEPQDIGENLVSERVRKLRKDIDAAEIGEGAAAKVDESLRAVASFADKKLSNLSPSETKELAEHFDALLKLRGAQSSSPEKLLGNWDEFLRSYDLNPSKATAADVIRAVNKRDAGHLASMGTGMAGRNRALGIAENQVQSVKDMFGGAERSRADILSGKASRTGEPLLGGNAGRAQFGLDELQNSLTTPEDKLALRLAKAAREGKAVLQKDDFFPLEPGEVRPDYILPKEFADDLANMHRGVETEVVSKRAPWAMKYDEPMRAVNNAADDLLDADPFKVAAAVDAGFAAPRNYQAGAVADAVNKEISSGFSGDTNALIGRARELEQKLKQIDLAKENAELDASQRRYLDLLGRKAQSEYDRIVAGRGAVKKGAMGIGALIGSGAGEPYSGAIAGGAAASQLLRGADIAGQLGQKMTANQSVIEGLAKKLAMDPSSPVGRMAMWALDGGPGRLLAFARVPEIKDMLLQQSP